jgi:hypothetical protein
MASSKGKLPPSFRKAAKQIAKTGPAKNDKVVDQQGRTGTVLSIAGGMVKVKHDDGDTDIHPVGRVQKLAPTRVTPSAPNKKIAKKKAK